MEAFGTALAAIVGIALWDLVRMTLQTWYLEKRLKKDQSDSPDKSCCCKKCPCKESLKEVDKQS